MKLINRKEAQRLTMKAITASALLGLIGCKGSDTTGSEYIDHIKIEQDTATFDYTFSFSSNIEVDMEGQYDIKDYGNVTFYSDPQGKFNIRMLAKFDLAGEPMLEPASSLPNGASFPTIVQGTLYSLKLGRDLTVYVQKEATADNVRLAGVALQLKEIQNNIPQISLTENFWDGDKRYAAFTIFGPRLKDGVEQPGGIFITADINKLIDRDVNQSGVRKQRELSGPEAYRYVNDLVAQKVLFENIEAALAKHGIRIKDHN